MLKAYPDVPKVMSRATHEIIDPEKRLRNIVYVEHGEIVEVAGIEFSAFNAGHIIGSLQFFFEMGGKEIVFTGDFNLEKRLILRPAQILKGDVLIIDATYGAPHYVFPQRGELYRKVVSIARDYFEEGLPIIFKGRRIGTAQELVALMNASTDVLPLVEDAIARHNFIYEMHGEWLGMYAYWNAQAPDAPLPIIVGLNSTCRGRIPSCICTGWAKGKQGLPLSSHADYSQIIRYVKESNASFVIPFCGFREELVKTVSSELGIESSCKNNIEIKD